MGNSYAHTGPLVTMGANKRREDVIITTPDFRFSLEPYGGDHYIHQDVYRWSPKVRKLTQRIIDDLAERYSLKVAAREDDAKLQRYAGLYGFQRIDTRHSLAEGCNYIILARKT